MFQTRHFVLFLAIEISHTLLFFINCQAIAHTWLCIYFIFILCAAFDFAKCFCFFPIVLLLLLLLELPRFLVPSCTFYDTLPPPGSVNAAAASLRKLCKYKLLTRVSLFVSKHIKTLKLFISFFIKAKRSAMRTRILTQTLWLIQ